MVGTTAPDTPSSGSTVDATPAWHALEAAEVLDRLATTPRGLRAEEVAVRLERYGPNQLREEPPPHPLVVLARQFRSPLIYILVLAAVVTIVLEKYLDAIVIAAVLALNATIGFIQERKAEGAVRALLQLVVPQAHALRDGQERVIDSRELVPGDVVTLEPGASVPADLRLLATTGLQIDESMLTGESLPVTKREATVPVDTAMSDRDDMAFTGTVVARGRGRGVVVATGDHTELGAIADLIHTGPVLRTPLQQRMDRFAKIIGVVVGLASAVAFGSGVALGGDTGDMFLTAVALAVAAIPEGLPVAFTVTLALGVHRMAGRRAIVRRLPAVETLGSTTVIGSDKTGTLTENRMTVQSIWAGGHRWDLDEGAGFVTATGPLAAAADPVLDAAVVTGVLANEAHVEHDDHHASEITGDPTEVALLVAAERVGVDLVRARAERSIVAEVPFEPELRYSASLRDGPEGRTLHVKGAPERVVDLCDRMLTVDGEVPVDPDAVLVAAHALAADGLRVLAMAARPAPDLDRLDDEPSGLVLLGLQGMLDPPREGVAEAVAEVGRAGIRVVMITGDHAVTARAIATRLGITAEDGAVLTGSEMAELDDDALDALVDDVSVYARVAPEDKLRIVLALQRRGEVVAVTGDGVNDAPALRAASIGVAMGDSGTDVAREAADMVLADDNFVTIAAAVEEGRITFDNVRKVTFFLVSTGAAAIIAIIASVWLQWPLLMLPAQLLWLNLVTNGIQDVALAFEPGERGVLRRKPRRTSEGVLDRTLWERAGLAGAVMAVGTLVMFRWELDRTDSLQAAQTVALTTLVIAMAFHAGSSRSRDESLFRLDPRTNPLLSIATASAVTLHVAALYLPPTQYVLRVEPIEAAAWWRMVLAASASLAVVELDKWVRRRVRARADRTGPAQDRGQPLQGPPRAATPSAGRDTMSPSTPRSTSSW